MHDSVSTPRPPAWHASRRGVHRHAWVIAVFALSGCGDSETNPKSDDAKHSSQGASGEPSHAPLDASAPDRLGAPFHVSMKVNDVAPGAEGTRCLKVRLGNDGPVNIARIRNQLSAHTHHFVLSYVPDPSEDEAPAFDCMPFRAPLAGGPLTVTQKADEQIDMPEGVGFTLAGNQLMHLEIHFINPGTEPTDVMAEADLFPLSGDAPIQEAGFFIAGNLNINIPAHTQAHSSGDAFAAQPAALEGAHYYAITGHTHRFGTSVRVGVADGQSADTKWIYEPQPFNWDAPQVEYLERPLQVPAGGGFHLQCTWDNPTDITIRYGESALTEMCFFWAYYYPRAAQQQVVLAGLENSMYAKDGGMAP